MALKTGLNHHTAPLAVRERVVFHVERLRDALGEIRSGLASEAAILSTCNRTGFHRGRASPGGRGQLAREIPRL